MARLQTKPQWAYFLLRGGTIIEIQLKTNSSEQCYITNNPLGKHVKHNSPRSKKMLLVTNLVLFPKRVISHGLNLSKRMDSSLEILHVLKDKLSQESSKAVKENLLQCRTNGPIGYTQLINHRGLTTETVEYAKQRRNISCVLLCLQGEGPPRRKGSRQRKFEELTQLLNCPVVLCTENPAGK